MTNNEPRTYAVRLGVSMTRDERNAMRRRFGNSHSVRISNSLQGWATGSCTCHSLNWATTDLEHHWGSVDAPITCPITRNA